MKIKCSGAIDKTCRDRWLCGVAAKARGHQPDDSCWEPRVCRRVNLVVTCKEVTP